MKSSIRSWTLILLVAVLTGCGSNFQWFPDPNSNTAPAANAGADQTVPFNTLVTLDGSGSSDPDGNPLTYIWAITTKPAGSAAILQNPASINPSFIPDAVGEYALTLRVNDGTTYSLPATVKVTASPIANAGPDQYNVIVNSTVTLDGSASSAPAGDSLTYQWEFTSFPTANAPILTITDPAKPRFVPTVVGSYTLSLIVYDGSIPSPPSTVTINVITNTGSVTITW